MGHSSRFSESTSFKTSIPLCAHLGKIDSSLPLIGNIFLDWSEKGYSSYTTRENVKSSKCMKIQTFTIIFSSIFFFACVFFSVVHDQISFPHLWFWITKIYIIWKTNRPAVLAQNVLLPSCVPLRIRLQFCQKDDFKIDSFTTGTIL